MPTSPWVPTPLIATRLVTRSRDVSTYAQNLPMKVLLTLILYNISMTADTLIGEKEVLWLKVPQPHQLLTADIPFSSVWHFELTPDNRLVFQFFCQLKTLQMKVEICLEFKQCRIFFKDSNNKDQSKDWKTAPMTGSPNDQLVISYSLSWRCQNDYPDPIRAQ